jgi:hypothetical protein
MGIDDRQNIQVDEQVTASRRKRPKPDDFVHSEHCAELLNQTVEITS